MLPGAFLPTIADRHSPWSSTALYSRRVAAVFVILETKLHPGLAIIAALLDIPSVTFSATSLWRWNFKYPKPFEYFSCMTSQLYIRTVSQHLCRWDCENTSGTYTAGVFQNLFVLFVLVLFSTYSISFLFLPVSVGDECLYSRPSLLMVSSYSGLLLSSRRYYKCIYWKFFIIWHSLKHYDQKIHRLYHGNDAFLWKKPLSCS